MLGFIRVEGKRWFSPKQLTSIAVEMLENIEDTGLTESQVLTLQQQESYI